MAKRISITRGRYVSNGYKKKKTAAGPRRAARRQRYETSRLRVKPSENSLSRNNVARLPRDHCVARYRGI